MNNGNTYDIAVNFQHVSVSFGDNEILKDFSLEVQKGECLTIIGTSGCGKTTMLRLVNGLLLPSSGTVEVNGQDVGTSDLIKLRREIGYAIQNVGLFPHMTVRQNIAYVPSLSKRWNRQEENRQIQRLLTVVGLDAAMADRYPSELSGGQKQRVGIARALAANPQLLLLDEPFGALDAFTRDQMQSLLLKLWQDSGKQVLLITHDIEEAILLSDRIYLLTGKPGRITEEIVIREPKPRRKDFNLTEEFLNYKREILAALDR